MTKVPRKIPPTHRAPTMPVTPIQAKRTATRRLLAMQRRLPKPTKAAVVQTRQATARTCRLERRRANGHHRRRNASKSDRKRKTRRKSLQNRGEKPAKNAARKRRRRKRRRAAKTRPLRIVQLTILHRLATREMLQPPDPHNSFERDIQRRRLRWFRQNKRQMSMRVRSH